MALSNRTAYYLSDDYDLESFTAADLTELRDSEIKDYFNSNLREESKDEAQEIVREIMQRCIAIGQESHENNLKILKIGSFGKCSSSNNQKRKLFGSEFS